VDNDGDSLIDCADPDCAATPCDDGQYCTVNDQCQSGSCVGAARSCSDGNACTEDSCDEGNDACAHDGAALNGSPCEDGAFCTAGDTCAGGTCVPSGPTDCSAAGDDCNVGVCNETSNQCEPQPVNNGSPCEDGLFCTTGEICVGGSCEGGSVLECDDGNSCTLDACDELGSQCSNVIQPGCCGNGLLEAGEGCDDGNQIDGDGCEADCTVSTACSFTHGVGGERFVGGCGAPSFPDIQAAIDASQDGDVVSVCPGTYTQSVQVSREVTLRSTGGPAVTTIHAASTALSLLRSGVSIEGFTLISDGAAAIEADAICPLQQASCVEPRGSNVRIAGNVIRDSATGVEWASRVDCAEIQANSFVDNDAHIALLQATGPPAILVEIGGEAGGMAVGNQLSGGGSAGVALEVAGIEVAVVANSIEDAAQTGLVVRDVSSTTPVTIAANTVRGSGASGVVVSGLPNGSQMVENTIDANVGDGVTVGAGADGVNIENNNITGNGVGLGNEAAAGTLDATLNWWSSQTGPGGLFAGNGDTVVNRGGAATDFIEFLCRPFPEGFASVDGVCSVETAELRQLVPGRSPDLDPFGRFVVFEASSDMDVDARSPLNNPDGSQEVFLLDRRPRPKVGGVCLGGLLPCNFDNVQSCAACTGNDQCPGDPLADPIVLNGECVQVTQLSNGTGGMGSRRPRITGRGKDVVYATNDNQMGSNPDGSAEIAAWNRRTFEKGDSLGAHAMFTSAGAGGDFDSPAPSLSGRFVAMESNTDPLGDNGDGNVEIFVYGPKKDVWFQVTRTTGFCSVSGGDCLDDGDCEGPGDTCQQVTNSRPSTIDGKRIAFESTGDLHNDPKFPGVNNPDHNREIFVAKLRSNGRALITQVTDTLAPVENLAPTSDTRANLVAFSSNGNLDGQHNADGNREIFLWSRKAKSFDQLTVTAAGESTNPVISTSGRWFVFESTADLNSNGASNRRVFQYDRELGELLTLSRLRFGTNQLPRIRRRRFVTWESTANLTGGNPNGNWVIFVFDRKKDD
jgi:cysteine-rich repeat protein